MSWLQFWKRDTERALQGAAESATPDADTAPAHPIVGSPGAQDSRMLPLHMQKIAGERRRPADTRVTHPALRLARMKKQRIALLFDVDQGELAASDDNPWTNRIALLTDAMETVHEDQQRLRTAPPAPYSAVPATPIKHLATSEHQPFEVTFTIGPEAFTYQEELDWAERGHQMALPELIRCTGSAGALVPDTTPSNLRNALQAHLFHSLDVFASDMRDRRLDQEPLPLHPTLADLAKPCPACGGWTDWKGRCANCAVRAADEMRLKREETHLLDERAREAEERHRLTERLPMVRRRLADLDAEMDTLENELQSAGR
ncbi:MAG: hypothetical protein ACR2OE_02970 [Thermomicrobiales bacterium]